MIFSIIVASVFAFAAIVCYASELAASRADKRSEEWFRLKIQENDADKRNENDGR